MFFSVKKTNGDSLEFVVGFPDALNAKNLASIFNDQNVPLDDICELRIKSYSIEVKWGAQFVNFHHLKRLELIADDRIKINCSSTKGSEIQALVLIAREIWFNDGAFEGSEKLTEIYICGTILDGHHGGLPELLFRNCTNLRLVHGLYQGGSIMPCAFENCTSLESPLDFSVKKLGQNAFRNCSSLKAIHMHNGLETLGTAAFQNCTSLEDIYIPDTVHDLGMKTFDGCSRLSRIHLPQNIEEIPAGFLANCSSIIKVFLSDRLRRINEEAFMNCISLRNPWIPNGLISIGDRAFYGCCTIRDIYLPESIFSIGKDAFANISGLCIHGKHGSFAESYAKGNGISFIGEH